MDFLFDALSSMHPVAALAVIVAIFALLSSGSAAIGAGLGMLAVNFIGSRFDRVRISGDVHHG